MICIISVSTYICMSMLAFLISCNLMMIPPWAFGIKNPGHTSIEEQIRIVTRLKIQVNDYTHNLCMFCLTLCLQDYPYHSSLISNS